MKPATRTKPLCNIYIGQYASKTVYMNKYIQLGCKQMKEFKAALSQGFHNTIQKTVKAMKEIKKKVETGDVAVYNTEAIYSRVTCLMNGKQVDLEDIFNPF